MKKNEQYGKIDWNLQVNQLERLSKLRKFLNTKGGYKNFSFFLSGFVEGEGSLWASVVLFPSSTLGIKINLGFSIYQHESGLPLLILIRDYFKTGRIYLKSGSLNVWVFEINDRTSLREKVIPFFQDYILPLSCKFGTLEEGTFFHFHQILLLFQQKKHLNKQGLISCIHHVYKTNPLGKGKSRKRSLNEIIHFISERNT